MSTDQKAKRTAFGAVHTMPTREEVREQQPTTEKAPGPGAVPQTRLSSAGPTTHLVPESCVNFTLPGGGNVLLNVPTALSWQDALFAARVIGDFLTSLADRMKV